MDSFLGGQKHGVGQEDQDGAGAGNSGRSSLAAV